MKKDVWANDIERDAWVEKNCRTCFQRDEAMKRITGDGPGCPHLLRAEQNKLPTPWTRRRNAAYGDTYRCAEHAIKPPVTRRGTVTEEIEPLFDLEPHDVHLVPVESWPDWRSEQRKQKDGDHQ